MDFHMNFIQCREMRFGLANVGSHISGYNQEKCGLLSDWLIDPETGFSKESFQILAIPRFINCYFRVQF